MLLMGIGFTVFALAAFMYALFALPGGRIRADRRRFGVDAVGDPTLTRVSDYLVSTTDRYLRHSSWVPFRARELELAGLAVTPGTMVVTVSAIGIVALALVSLATGSVLVGVLVVLLVLGGTKIYLATKISKRRAAFSDQLDSTIQMIASALRAGNSFPQALNAVATEADSPTAEEFARVVNEHRIGRDLVLALEQTAERMDSEDFGWVTEAVAVHRDTGGNLNEVLDRVGETIRERNQVRQQVEALAAEGKLSGIVMMALPVVVVGGFSIVNPQFMTPMFQTTIGWIMLAISFVLYVIGGFWIRAVSNVKF